MIELARGLHAEHPLGRVAAYDAEAVGALLRHSLGLETWALFVWVDEDAILGFMCGLMTPLYFNPALRVASELCCYVDPTARGKQGGAALYDAFFAWAKAQGVTAVQCGVPIGMAALAHFFVHREFSPLQTLYVRSMPSCVPV
jgi:GNAT superfamily N-acetyltransferase